MATNPVNLIDAVAEVIPRLARNRSAVLRTGVVATAPAAGVCEVRVGGANVKAGYHTHYRPVVGHVVSLINDGDRWLVVGQMAAT